MLQQIIQKSLYNTRNFLITNHGIKNMFKKIKNKFVLLRIVRRFTKQS